MQKGVDIPLKSCYNNKRSVENGTWFADVVEWQTRYLEVVVSYARVGSSPVIRTKRRSFEHGFYSLLFQKGSSCKIHVQLSK